MLFGTAKTRLMLVFAGAALATTDSLAQDPTLLVTHGRSLFRIHGATIEEFDLGVAIVAMATVEPGSSVLGCRTGDVVAFREGHDGVFRLDNAQSGTPALTNIGTLTPDWPGHSDAVVRGEVIYTIAGRLFAAWDSSTFARIGEPIDLRPTGNPDSGGLAYDGAASWYITNSNGNHLVHLNDPPAPEDWTSVDSGGIGMGFSNSDLAWHDGTLWGALQRQTAEGTYYVVLGTFDLTDGQFAIVHTVSGAANSRVVGMAIVGDACSGDIDADGSVGLSDLVILLANFGETAAEAEDGDMDADGDVDLSDLSLMLGRFGVVC